ncbi:MAG: transcriptional repressor [Chloroflexi bacterium]|nr:transcriptional repressor [Chloroflexota bacterium]
MNSKSATFVQVLQENGYRLTRARQAVFNALVATGGHVSADDLATAVRQNASHVGRMTVYRTLDLDLLSELGLVRPVYQGTGAAHYVLMHAGHHHHLVCSFCDQVIEFDDCALAEMEQIIGQRFQFAVKGHLLLNVSVFTIKRDCAALTEQGIYLGLDKGDNYLPFLFLSVSRACSIIFSFVTSNVLFTVHISRFRFRRFSPTLVKLVQILFSNSRIGDDKNVFIVTFISIVGKVK